VVGIGNSGVDIAVEVSRVAKQVCLISTTLLMEITGFWVSSRV
jgi:cation diffusion facilitator CzcD-associated flavoprotein CzcO